MDPITYDLKIYQGQTFELSLIWKDEDQLPVDLTGYTAKMHIRATVKAPDVLIELSNTNSRIVLGAVPGQIKLLIPPEISSPILVQQGVYDLELTSPVGFVRRFMQGKVHFYPEVTR